MLVHSPVFPVPSLSGQVPDLRLFATNYSSKAARATFRCIVAADGGDTEVLRKTLQVPAGGTGEAIEDASGLQGDSVRLVVALSSRELIPSAAVVRTFIGDGGEDTIIWLAPTEFR